MQIGAISAVMLTVFAVIMAILLVAFIPSKIAEPSFESYSNKQAYLVAQTIASSVNALSTMGQGEDMRGLIQRDFEKEWNIKVSKKGDNYYIEVSHDKYKSTEIGDVVTLGDTSVVNIEGVNRVIISKNSGEDVKIHGELVYG